MLEDFGYIYDQYVTRIYRFIFLKVPSQEVAEDLCSEVFLQTFRQSKKTTIVNIQAFLYQVARRTVADYYRAQERSNIVSLDNIEEIQQNDIGLLEEVLLRSDMEEVRKALLTLHDEYQNLIIWRYLDELSIPEIAEIEDRSEGSVRVGLHRAMEALRSKLIGHNKKSNVPM